MLYRQWGARAEHRNLGHSTLCYGDTKSEVCLEMAWVQEWVVQSDYTCIEP